MVEPAERLGLSTAEIRQQAEKALLEVANDLTAPSAARAAAARTLLEMVGAIGRNSSPSGDPKSRSLGELSGGDLEAEIARLLGSKKGAS